MYLIQVLVCSSQGLIQDFTKGDGIRGFWPAAPTELADQGTDEEGGGRSRFGLP